MQTTLAERQQSGPAAQLRLQLGLCFFSFILIGLNDGGTGVLLPSLMGQYNVDKATISLMFLAATFGYLSAALSSGLLVQRLGRRVFMMLGTGVFALGALALTLAPPFTLFLVALFCLGGGAAILDAGLNAYIAGLPNNTGPLNYLHAFYGVGALGGPVVASAILAIGLGWNYTYLVWLVIVLVALVGFARLFDNSRPSEQAEEGNVLAAALRLPLVWLVSAFLFVYVGAEVSLGSWGYSFLTQERHEPELLSAWTVSGYWLGLTVGRLVLGKVGGQLGNRRLIELCLVGVVVGVLLVWLAPIGLVSAVGLLLTGFSLGPIFPTTIALISELVPARILPSAIGFAASLGSVGAALAPFLVGNMAQAVGLWTLLPFDIALTVVMLLLWFVLARQGANDE